MYKVGIIGLGQIAYSIDKDPNRKIIWSHIKAYQSIAKTEISCVCDVDELLVSTIKDECDIPKGYVDYNLMLEENNIDIVSICTPINTHTEIIKKCVDFGVKAIFCEKTLSYSLGEAINIVSYCRDRNVILGVNHILRWDLFINKIKSFIDKKIFGEIYIIDCYGTTAMHTSTSHLIDLMCFFINSEPEWVTGVKQKDYIRKVHGVNDFGGAGLVKFKNNVIGFIKSIGESEYNYSFEMSICCERGKIVITDNGNRCQLYEFVPSNTSVGSKYKTLMLNKTIKKVDNERMIAAVNNIIDGIEDKRRVLSSGESSLKTLKIITGITNENKITQY